MPENRVKEVQSGTALFGNAMERIRTWMGPVVLDHSIFDESFARITDWMHYEKSFDDTRTAKGVAMDRHFAYRQKKPVKTKRIIVCGSRFFQDYEILCDALDRIIQDPTNTEIVSGKARGADTLGEQYAREHGIKVAEFPAEWKKYGKAAGFKRNREMLQYAKEADPMVVAFWDGKSAGTRDMIYVAKNANVEVQVVMFLDVQVFLEPEAE